MKRNKTEMEAFMNELAKEMGIHELRIKLKKWHVSDITGRMILTNSGGNVELSKVSFVLWSENDNLAKYLMAHELVHLKYRDATTNAQKEGLLSKYEGNAVNLLSEIRAEIESAKNLRTLEGDSFDLESVYQTIHKYNYRLKLLQRISSKPEFKYEDGLKTVKLGRLFCQGYASYKMISHYTNRYNAFTEEAQIELLNTFYDVLALDIQKDKDDFIRTVRTYFSEHYNYKESLKKK